jgi:hypothetical protein
MPLAGVKEAREPRATVICADNAVCKMMVHMY